MEKTFIDFVTNTAYINVCGGWIYASFCISRGMARKIPQELSLCQTPQQ
jgi:hypothetical protein